MEPQGSLPCSQEPATCSYFSNITFDIILPSTPLLAHYNPCPIWPLVLPLDLSYTLLIRLLLFSYSSHSTFQVARPIFRCHGCSKGSVQVRGSVWHYVTCCSFYSADFLAPRSTLKLENHPLSAYSDWLFSILTPTLHIKRPSPPSATWRRAMTWWQGPTKSVNNKL